MSESVVIRQRSTVPPKLWIGALGFTVVGIVLLVANPSIFWKVVGAFSIVFFGGGMLNVVRRSGRPFAVVSDEGIKVTGAPMVPWDTLRAVRYYPGGTGDFLGLIPVSPDVPWMQGAAADVNKAAVVGLRATSWLLPTSRKMANLGSDTTVSLHGALIDLPAAIEVIHRFRPIPVEGAPST